MTPPHLTFLTCARSAVILTALTLISTLGEAVPIKIQEVVYDAAGPDSPHVFTELVGAPGTVLDGWLLIGVNGSTGLPYRTLDLTGAVIPDDGIFVITTSRASVALAAERDFIGAVDWQNGPDAVQLWSSLEELADALQYGDAGEGNRGEGEPAEDVDPGLALTRDASGTDTDNNAADFRSASPTPGRLGESAIPLPAPPTMATLVLGTALLFNRKR